MGEFADDIIDRMWDERLDGFGDDPFCDQWVGRRLPPVPRCHRCNGVLTFELNRNAKWVPTNPDGSPHSCQARATAEDFPAL